MARRVAVPDHVSRLDPLDRVDDRDAFAARVPPAALARHTPEQLAALVMARAPRWLMQVLVPAVHRHVLRLPLDPAAPTTGPSGWRQLGSSPDAVVFGIGGPLVTFRLAVAREPDELLIATVTRFERTAARPVWAVVAVGHRAVIRYLVGLGARLAVASG